MTNPVQLGRCDNHIDNMSYGGLLPKGARCTNQAIVVTVYVETINPWDGEPNTREVSKLCQDCLSYMKKHLAASKRHRRKVTGRSESKYWPRKLSIIQLEKVMSEHVRDLLNSYKHVPNATLEHLGVNS